MSSTALCLSALSPSLWRSHQPSLESRGGSSDRWRAQGTQEYAAWRALAVEGVWEVRSSRPCQLRPSGEWID